MSDKRKKGSLWDGLKILEDALKKIPLADSDPETKSYQPPVLTSGERLVWAAEFSASARWNRSLDPLLRQRCAMEDALEAVLFMRRTASNNPPGDSQATMMLHEMLES